MIANGPPLSGCLQWHYNILECFPFNSFTNLTLLLLTFTFTSCSFIRLFVTFATETPVTPRNVFTGLASAGICFIAFICIWSGKQWSRNWIFRTDSSPVRMQQASELDLLLYKMGLPLRHTKHPWAVQSVPYQNILLAGRIEVQFLFRWSFIDSFRCHFVYSG